MVVHKPQKTKTPPPQMVPRILVFLISIAAISALFMISSLFSSTSSSSTIPTLFANTTRNYLSNGKEEDEKYLYWGDRIDCPGKHCQSCEGLGHQESSLRCALEEALFLRRTFVMPSRMCINPIHNKKGILHQANNASLEEMWATSSCAMDSLYDLDLISATVPVILDNSKKWHQVVSTSMKLGDRGVAHVEGVNRADLRGNSRYSNLLLLNRTASPLSWFMECKDRNNRSAIMIPYTFLPDKAAKKLRYAAEKVMRLLGEYAAIHVRRGDKIKTKKDSAGVERSLHPHLDRDTRAEFILHRIQKWVPPGSTLFIASNERTPGFFSPLAARYKLVYSSNYSQILEPVIENNYHLFMVERVIMNGAKTWIKTFKEDDTDLSLTDDPKKNTKAWEIPVYTMD